MKKMKKFLSVLTVIAVMAAGSISVSADTGILEADEDVTSMIGSGAEDIETPSCTLEQLVSKDGSFEDHSFLYSEKYKFEMEKNKNGTDVLVVYGVPDEDVYGWKFKEYIEANQKEYDWVVDVGIFPAGAGRCIYSGYRFPVFSSESELKKYFEVMFFIDNEIPYECKTVEEANEAYGFDISKYIYSDSAPTDAYNVPEGAEAEKYGDVNGDSGIDIADVVGLNLFILDSEGYTMTDTQIANSDCVKDNVINSGDCALLLNCVAMLIDESDLGK